MNTFLFFAFYYSQWSVCFWREWGQKLKRMSKHETDNSWMPIHRVDELSIKVTCRKKISSDWEKRQVWWKRFLLRFLYFFVVRSWGYYSNSLKATSASQADGFTDTLTNNLNVSQGATIIHETYSYLCTVSHKHAKLNIRIVYPYCHHCALE